MGELVRFGISIDNELLERFDLQIAQKGYTNRSEAIRDLIRDDLVAQEWARNEETVGTITIVYDHHTRELSETLTHLQHSFDGQIMSVLHVHLDHHNCLEVLVVRGRSQRLKAFADRLVGTRGVKHGKLTMTTTGEHLMSAKDVHEHPHAH